MIVELVEVMSMRECAFLGTDPAVRARHGNAAAERERAATVGPRPARQLQYMAQFLAAYNIFP